MRWKKKQAQNYKKMENKYYTPKIESFHIGFRYEEELKNTNWHKLIKPTEDTWEFVKMEFDTSKSISKITQKIKQGKIRVKSLDHDDIKEAGWEESKTSFSPGRQYYNLGDYECFLEDGIVYIYREWADDGQNLFVGSIKNYNKLLEVMDMIGVEIK